MPDETNDFRVQARIADVVAVMVDFRRRRLRHMIDHPDSVTDDDKMPDGLRREAEARAILKELNLAVEAVDDAVAAERERLAQMYDGRNGFISYDMLADQIRRGTTKST